MTAFPWTTLITGASALAGALGAVGLKGRYDVRDQQRQTREAAAVALTDRRRESYTSLLVAARQLLANLQQMRDFAGSVTDATVPGLNEKMDGRSDQLSLAAASVELLASDGVRATERELADAAQVFTDFRLEPSGEVWGMSTPTGYDEEHIQAAQQRLLAAVNAFADAARTELNGPAGALPSQPLAAG